MKHLLFSALVMTASISSLQAQKYFTRSAHIDFFSHTKIEDIKADNDAATLVLDSQTGQVEISCTIKSFEFEKALMQEHFNENYMESDSYPSSTFKGKLENIASVSFVKDGVYTTQATGTLNMHGVDRNITTPVTITVKEGKITAETHFEVSPKDYNITIPGAVRQQIAESIAVNVKASLAELQR
jgi:polyisoprenoid-binding protein YceI